MALQSSIACKSVWFAEAEGLRLNHPRLLFWGWMRVSCARERKRTIRYTPSCLRPVDVQDE